MAYENVDVARAKNAINNCLNDINLKHETSSNLLTTLPNSNEWVADSKSTFLSAVDTLVNTRYEELKSYLNKCLTTLDQIEKYKNLQAQNASLNYQINSKTSEYNTVKSKYNNLSDKTTAEADDLKRKMNSLEREISSLKSQRDNAASDMNSINNSISA